MQPSSAAASEATSTHGQARILTLSLLGSAIASVPSMFSRSRSNRKVQPRISIADSHSSWTKWPYGDIRNCITDGLFARLAKTYDLPLEQVWALRFTFPNARDEPSVIVTRENSDSLGLLLKTMWEVGKSGEDEIRFRIHADPQINPDTECKLVVDY